MSRRPAILVYSASGPLLWVRRRTLLDRCHHPATLALVILAIIALAAAGAWTLGRAPGTPPVWALFR